jgi:hypothetical protein
MGGSSANGRRVQRIRRDASAYWPGAVVIAALAATDMAYRILMREPLRRALGIETKHA